MTTREHLLIVEDEQFIREMLVTAIPLYAPQFIVTTAETLAEAIRLLNERYFDAVLLDLGITGVSEDDPTEAVGIIKASSPKTQIVVFSGATDTLRAKAIARGAYSWIQKGREAVPTTELAAVTVTQAVEHGEVNQFCGEIKKDMDRLGCMLKEMHEKTKNGNDSKERPKLKLETL